MRLKIGLIVITLTILLGSCIRREIIEVPIKDSTSLKINREFVAKEIPLPADSSTVKALFRCDSLGRVYLAEINSLQGHRVKQETNFVDGVFLIKATDNATKRVEKSRTDTTSVIIREVPVRVEVPVTTNILTRLQQAQVYLGRILLIILAIMLLIKFNPIKFNHANKH